MQLRSNEVEDKVLKNMKFILTINSRLASKNLITGLVVDFYRFSPLLHGPQCHGYTNNQLAIPYLGSPKFFPIFFQMQKKKNSIISIFAQDICEFSSKTDIKCAVFGLWLTCM